RKGIIEPIARSRRIRPPGIKLQAGRIHRQREAIGIVLVAGLQWMDAAQMHEIRDRSCRGELLRSGNDNAVVALLDYAGTERRIALLVRRLAAVDLRRNDRVGSVEVLVAQLLVKGNNVIGKMLAGRGENAWRCCIAAEKPGDMVGRASHQSKCGFGPRFGKHPTRREVRMTVRYLIG